jgi:hypothetical protein
MLEKSDLRTWEAIVVYARVRAAQSLKRNDPIAWAYWKETETFSKSAPAAYSKPDSWKMGAFDCVQKAKLAKARSSPMESALWYSRAKWFVILARANGIVMDPKKTGVNLQWLEEDEEVRNAIARPMASTH